jgi:hypothetical protein
MSVAAHKFGGMTMVLVLGGTGTGGVDVGRPEVGADPEALFGVVGLVFWLATVVA